MSGGGENSEAAEDVYTKGCRCAPRPSALNERRWDNGPQ